MRHSSRRFLVRLNAHGAAARPRGSAPHTLSHLSTTRGAAALLALGLLACRVDVDPHQGDFPCRTGAGFNDCLTGYTCLAEPDLAPGTGRCRKVEQGGDLDRPDGDSQAGGDTAGGGDQSASLCGSAPCPDGYGCLLASELHGGAARCERRCTTSDDCAGIIEIPDLDSGSSNGLYCRSPGSGTCACVEPVIYDPARYAADGSDRPLPQGVCRPRCASGTECSALGSWAGICTAVNEMPDAVNSQTVCVPDPCLTCTAAVPPLGCERDTYPPEDLNAPGSGFAHCVFDCLADGDCNGKTVEWRDGQGHYLRETCDGSPGCVCVQDLRQGGVGRCRPKCDLAQGSGCAAYPDHLCQELPAKDAAAYPAGQAPVCYLDPCVGRGCVEGSERCVRLDPGRAYCEPRCTQDQDCERSFSVETNAGPVQVQCQSAGPYECRCVQDVLDNMTDTGLCRPACPLTATAGNQLSKWPCLTIARFGDDNTRQVALDVCSRVACAEDQLCVVPPVPPSPPGAPPYHRCEQACATDGECLDVHVSVVLANDFHCSEAATCDCVDVGLVAKPGQQARGRCRPTCIHHEHYDQCTDLFPVGQTPGYPLRCTPGTQLEWRAATDTCERDPCPTVTCSTALNQYCTIDRFGPYCAQGCLQSVECDGKGITLLGAFQSSGAFTCPTDGSGCACIKDRRSPGQQHCAPTGCTAAADSCTDPTFPVVGMSCQPRLDFLLLNTMICAPAPGFPCPEVNSCQPGQHCGWYGWCAPGCQEPQDCYGYDVDGSSGSLAPCQEDPVTRQPTCLCAVPGNATSSTAAGVCMHVCNTPSPGMCPIGTCGQPEEWWYGARDRPTPQPVCQ